MSDYDACERYVVETEMDEFIRYCRVFAFCNFELSLDPNVSMEQKDELIDERIDSSMHMMYSDELDMFITLDKVEQLLNIYMKYDAIDELHYFDNMVVLMEALKTITMQIIMDGYSKLVDEGKAVMYATEDGDVGFKAVDR
jgi:hypothetical protein